MSQRGVFITFEGPEGAGKSTQIRSLWAWLKHRRIPVLFTREPGGTAIGQRLRKILLDRRSGKLDPVVELFLYEASRAHLVSEVIRPALRAGKVVIADRFQDSTWVYQGWAGGLDPVLVEKIGRAATGGLRPDLTLLLDLPVAKGLARVRHPNRMEDKPLSFHQRVRQGYLALARRETKRVKVIRADRPAEKVQEEIRKVVQGVLERRRRA